MQNQTAPKGLKHTIAIQKWYDTNPRKTTHTHTHKQNHVLSRRTKLHGRGEGKKHMVSEQHLYSNVLALMQTNFKCER